LGGQKPRFNDKKAVLVMLEGVLGEMVEAGTPPDVLTFAGNGEPTMHPDFEEIVDGVIALRDRLCPAAKVSVLSNATMLHKESVRRALRRVDNPILKLDSAFDKTVQLIDKPLGNYSVEAVVENMKLFEGECIVQTMFLRGEFEGQRVDNTTPEEVEAWLEKIKEIAPRSVMVYTIDRDTPAPNLEKVSVEELREIAERVRALGIECSVAG
jgi:wyosine [tRNA(Phe)-imidazoG37] synthetase (radical SAM superfamily)